VGSGSLRSQGENDSACAGTVVKYMGTGESSLIRVDSRVTAGAGVRPTFEA